MKYVNIPLVLGVAWVVFWTLYAAPKSPEAQADKWNWCPSGWVLLLAGVAFALGVWAGTFKS